MVYQLSQCPISPNRQFTFIGVYGLFYFKLNFARKKRLFLLAPAGFAGFAGIQQATPIFKHNRTNHHNQHQTVTLSVYLNKTIVTSYKPIHSIYLLL
jgi:hypothetical protein